MRCDRRQGTGGDFKRRELGFDEAGSIREISAGDERIVAGRRIRLEGDEVTVEQNFAGEIAGRGMTHIHLAVKLTLRTEEMDEEVDVLRRARGSPGGD